MIKNAKSEALNASKNAKQYIKHLKSEVSGKGRLVPKDVYEREASEIKRGGYKGSIKYGHLLNKAKIKGGNDVRASRHYLEEAGIKNKAAYAEQATHRKGEWMIHYK